ncbi:hypothetical protein HJC23_003571 [Cyclotella cryptica]|uniref:Uncharacterized protein n=1 Tax=Cyclotella cryptica TaxID=29204 RepID=A0ABD3NQU1_9STRA
MGSEGVKGGIFSVDQVDNNGDEYVEGGVEGDHVLSGRVLGGSVDLVQFLRVNKEDLGNEPEQLLPSCNDSVKYCSIKVRTIVPDRHPTSSLVALSLCPQPALYKAVPGTRRPSEQRRSEVCRDQDQEATCSFCQVASLTARQGEFETHLNGHGAIGLVRIDFYWPSIAEQKAKPIFLFRGSLIGSRTSRDFRITCPSAQLTIITSILIGTARRKQATQQPLLS